MRLQDKRARQSNALLFSPRQFCRTMVKSLAQTGVVEQPPGALFEIRGSVLRHQGRYQNILEHRALRQQVVVLKNKTYLFVPECGQTPVVKQKGVTAAQGNRSRTGGLERAQDVKQRAFSAAGGTDD